MACDSTCTCGCCEGTAVLTPAALYNRPGLDALAYRVGEHGSFFETMQARLSSTDFPALAGLGTRSTDDFSIALLDGWATIADVLTFYQERLANEGYLRTATERRSVLELARLVGYAPRPGVAATVYLSYEIDQNAAQPVVLPLGSRVQSLPGPGELPQTFETVERFTARREWNAIKPRVERPNSIDRILAGTPESPGARVFLQGISTGLKVNDALLIQYLDTTPHVYRISEVAPDPASARTLVRFTNWDGTPVAVPYPTAIDRALLTTQDSLAGLDPAPSPVRAVLTELTQFLTWLDAQAAAVPLDPSVAGFVQNDAALSPTLNALNTLRLAALSRASAKELAAAITLAASQIDTIRNQSEIGGSMGMQIDRLTTGLKGIDATHAAGNTGEDADASLLLRQILGRLDAARSVPPRNSQTLERDPAALFNANSDVGAQAVAALAPAVAPQLTSALRNARVSSALPIHVFAFRQKSLLFGSTAPARVIGINHDTGIVTTEEWTDADISRAENPQAVHLDSPQEKIQVGSWIALDYSAIDASVLGDLQLPSLAGNILIARVGSMASKLARTAYNYTAQTTRIGLADMHGNSATWFTVGGKAIKEVAEPHEAAPPPPPAFELIRHLVVYCDSEELALATEPIEDTICGGDQWIETDGLYSGLETGRWLVVTGERADVAGTDGILGSELVMLESVQQYVQKLTATVTPTPAGTFLPPPAPTFAPGETLHTFLKFASPLAFCYKRATAVLNANVVRATHGETRNETLGSGDASQALQTFALKQPPLTFVSANVPEGVASTLAVYVNGVEWQEAKALVALGPADRAFITTRDDDEVTSVIFGNGKNGARLRTGVANIKAIYRGGIGKAGNVRAGQINQLLSRPLGVKGVNNPQEAAGGADRETRDQARRNAPLAILALDRLVGTEDYAHFSRTFAGIAKAAAVRVPAGGVYVTIAGVDDTPIPPDSDLSRNLLAALQTHGDPALAVRLQPRQLLMLVMSARIALDPAYLWEDVVDAVRARLLDRYSFERQELGQGIALSEVVALIQNQRGVRYVVVEALGAVSQRDATGNLRSPQEISAALKAVIDEAARTHRPRNFVPVAGITSAKGTVLAAQLAFFVPSLPETLILNRIEN